MKQRDNIKIRKTITNVKGEDIEFDELYCIDPNTNEEVFDRFIEIENDIRLYDIYKTKNNLLTSKEIINIRKKYLMSQKVFSLLLGLGEITIHRFENGSIQSEAIDSIIRLSSDPDNMYIFLLKNKDNFDEETYNINIDNINKLKILKEHKIIEINKDDFVNLDFNIMDANDIAKKIIEIYNSNIDNIYSEYAIEENYNKEYITQLKLQKLLYYVQGIALKIFNKPAFNNNIYNWAYGPVVNDVYKIYKNNGKNPIIKDNNNIEISDGLLKIINLVVRSYGQMGIHKLINLTHNEDPWLNTKKDEKISIDEISNYFNLLYKD